MLLALQGGLASPGSLLTLSFFGRAGTAYQIQASEDFQNWQTIGETNCVVDELTLFSIADYSIYSQCFYRLSR